MLFHENITNLHQLASVKHHEVSPFLTTDDFQAQSVSPMLFHENITNLHRYVSRTRILQISRILYLHYDTSCLHIMHVSNVSWKCHERTYHELASFKYHKLVSFIICSGVRTHSEVYTYHENVFWKRREHILACRGHLCVACGDSCYLRDMNHLYDTRTHSLTWRVTTAPHRSFFISMWDENTF